MKRRPPGQRVTPSPRTAITGIAGFVVLAGPPALFSAAGARDAATARPVEAPTGGAAHRLQEIELPALRLEGRVLRGPDSVGLPGVTVELHRVTAESAGVVDSTTAGAEGVFHFRLSGSEGAVYLAVARYQGLRYFGSAVHDPRAVPGPYRIVVHDTTTVRPEEVEVALRHAVLDRTAGTIEVLEVFDLAGRADRTLVPAAAGPVWRAHLPAGVREAHAVPIGEGGGELRVEGSEVSLAGWLPPEGRRVAVRYLLPEATELELRVEHPTRRLELLVATGGGDVEVEGLAARDTLAVEGRPFLRFSGRELSSGSVIWARWRGGAAGAAPWLWLAAAVGLSVAALLTWRRGAEG